MRFSKKVCFTARVVVSIFLAGMLFLTPIQATAFSGTYLEAVKTFLQDMYIEDKTDEEMLEFALKGMLSNLDDYSSFMNQEETRAYETSLSGQFSGIGVTIEADVVPDGIVIGTVFADSPAEAAGLLDGDVLLSADGTSLAGLTPSGAANLIRGAADTPVVLGVRRGTLFFEVTAIRGNIVIEPVTWRMDDNIGYVRITQFSQGVGDGLDIALDAFRDRDIRKLVLDLRDNPGGYVNQAVDAARRLIPPGPITTVDYRSDRMSNTYHSTSQPDPGFLIAVLVNEKTASASEILSGAIQDAGNGFLVGKNTYGKGVVQSLFMFLTPEAYEKYGEEHESYFVTESEWSAYYGVAVQPDEVLGLAKLTTGRYLTRNGRLIEGIGLRPNAVAENRSAVREVDISLAMAVMVDETLSEGAYHPAVKGAETILKAEGYLVGVPDRNFSAETAQAIQAFQMSHGLTATGQLDRETAAMLNRRLSELRLEFDPQYRMALSALELFRD